MDIKNHVTSFVSEEGIFLGSDMIKKLERVLLSLVVGFAACDAMALISTRSVLSTAWPRKRNLPQTCWMKCFPFCPVAERWMVLWRIVWSCHTSAVNGEKVDAAALQAQNG